MTTKPKLKAGAADPAAEPIDVHGIDTLGFRLRLAQNLVFRDFNERFVDLGLTQSLWSILVLIEANPGLRQSDIGVALNIRPANLVDLLDSLIKRGLVLKLPIAKDRRASSLYLTTEGAATAAKGERIHQKHLRFLQERLGDDYEVLHAALKKLLD